MIGGQDRRCSMVRRLRLQYLRRFKQKSTSVRELAKAMLLVACIRCGGRTGMVLSHQGSPRFFKISHQGTTVSSNIGL